MLGPSCLLFLAVPLTLSASVPGGMLAYVGLGPGQELIPYFLALLAWLGGAIIAILQWPISALLRRLWRAKRSDKDGLKNEPATANVTESAGEGSQDKP